MGGGEGLLRIIMGEKHGVTEIRSAETTTHVLES